MLCIKFKWQHACSCYEHLQSTQQPWASTASNDTRTQLPRATDVRAAIVAHEVGTTLSNTEHGSESGAPNAVCAQQCGRLPESDPTPVGLWK